jgi:hypothetical protein
MMAAASMAPTTELPKAKAEERRWFMVISLSEVEVWDLRLSLSAPPAPWDGCSVGGAGIRAISVDRRFVFAWYRQWDACNPGASTMRYDPRGSGASQVGADLDSSPMLTTVAPFVTLVLLLVWMGFFMLGSLPLMILKHDTPLDARFIRGLFDVYYKAVMVVAAAGTLAHALAGRSVTSVAMAAVGAIAFSSRRIILSRMDRLRTTMTATDTDGIRQFRRLHVLGMVLNFVQLLAICAGLPIVL